MTPRLTTEQEPVIWHGSLAVQRAVMRDLCDKLGDDPEVICAAYIKAEQAEGIARTRGDENMASPLHARMLWREGTLKGWLRR